MIVEFRVPMPLKTEEFNRGWLYMVVAASEENSGGNDGAGVLVLKNEPYDNTMGNGHVGIVWVRSSKKQRTIHS